MPTDAEITFADHAGRLYARRYGMAPVVGRLLGYLAICDPREQSIADLAEVVRRTRAAGERMDRVGIDLTSPRAFGFDPTEYQEQAALAREGLAILAGAPPERRAVLLEMAAFAEWLTARLPEWEKDWRAHREVLRAAGELPGDTTHSPDGEESR